MSNVPVLLSITEPNFKGGAPANTPTEPARKPFLAKPKMEARALSQPQHRKSIPAAVLWVSGARSQATISQPDIERAKGKNSRGKTKKISLIKLKELAKKKKS